MGWFQEVGAQISDGLGIEGSGGKQGDIKACEKRMEAWYKDDPVMVQEGKKKCGDHSKYQKKEVFQQEYAAKKNKDLGWMLSAEKEAKEKRGKVINYAIYLVIILILIFLSRAAYKWIKKSKK